MQWMQRSILALLMVGALSLGLGGPAAAQVVIPDGLVNVVVIVGDDVLNIEDVNVGVAAQIVAAICPNVNVSDVAVLARQVDRSDDD